MKRYKHYSFDLWLTLIKSNPEFKLQRAKYLYENYNPLNHTLEKVQSIIREVDIMCNHINEVTGKSIDAFEMYAMVLYKMGYGNKHVGIIEKIYDHTIELFYYYPPTLYDNNTLEILQELKKAGSTISLTSNTGFIKGEELIKIFRNLGVMDLLSFTLFSDECNISKPDMWIFRSMCAKAYQLRGIGQISYEDIIHIGDNPFADIKGAIAAGINAFQINSNDKTIKDLL
jgi:putative hydrolase of the HAD superfamily